MGCRACDSDLLEVREIVQTTLDKVRSLSHALHPMVLYEVGLESAVDAYLPAFERQTGIEVRYEKTGQGRELDRELAIHLYRENERLQFDLEEARSEMRMAEGRLERIIETGDRHDPGSGFAMGIARSGLDGHGPGYD